MFRKNLFFPRPNPAFLAVALVMVAFLSGFPVPVSDARGLSDREIEVGDVMPKTTHQLPDGSEVSVPSDADLTVILFWATWSPRSAEALDLWEKFSRTYADQSLGIVTFNAEKDELGGEDRAAIDRYVEETGITLPVVIDEGLELFNTYGVKAVPTAFFLDREGKLLHRYPSLPSSAALDLQEELETRLGIREEPGDAPPAPEEIAYQPKNNAQLYYNMGVQYFKKGSREKALERFVAALQKDPDYPDPLRTLEGAFFADGRTAEAEGELRALLTEGGLGQLVDRIGEGEPIVLEGGKKVDAMERMRLLLEKGPGQ